MIAVTPRGLAKAAGVGCACFLFVKGSVSQGDDPTLLERAVGSEAGLMRSSGNQEVAVGCCSINSNTQRLFGVANDY
jgi:hypothetical protein